MNALPNIYCIVQCNRTITYTGRAPRCNWPNNYFQEVVIFLILSVYFLTLQLVTMPGFGSSEYTNVVTRWVVEAKHSFFVLPNHLLCSVKNKICLNQEIGGQFEDDVTILPAVISDTFKCTQYSFTGLNILFGSLNTIHNLSLIMSHITVIHGNHH